MIEDDESVSSGGRESHGLPGIMPEEQINMLKRAHMQAEQRTALGPENRASRKSKRPPAAGRALKGTPKDQTSKFFGGTNVSRGRTQAGECRL